MITLRPYQVDIIDMSCLILTHSNFVYLAMQVRTGKTLTAIGICDKMKYEKVLFITKKKAIGDITADRDKYGVCFTLDVINYESIHKMPEHGWDCIICDEAHRLGSFPKPGKAVKVIKKIVEMNQCKVILMSGTPSPESYSQLYHQTYFIPGSPFAHFKNFYAFAKQYVNVYTMNLGYGVINQYDKGLDTIVQALEPFTIRYTQEEAGFQTEVQEEVLEVPLKDDTYAMIRRLKDEMVLVGKDDVILADTAVKLQSKMHQMYSGTIKFEPRDDGTQNSMVFDLSKAQFIRQFFAGKKIAIFYKFVEELNAIKQVYGDDITTDLNEFRSTDKCIALQIQSGREGISLKDAEYIVYYNIDFSAVSYWQSRDRMTTKDRTYNKVYWVFSKGGIEHQIYKVVSKKKDFTLRHFRKVLDEL